MLNDHSDVMATWKTDHERGHGEREEKGQESLTVIPGRRQSSCQEESPGKCEKGPPLDGIQRKSQLEFLTDWIWGVRDREEAWRPPCFLVG